MLSNIKAVIFDLDGTLVDSMWMWERIDIEYLSRFQLELPKGMEKEIAGMSFSETAQYFKTRFGLQDSVEQIKQDWNQMAWDKYQYEVTTKPGAKLFLKYLKNRGIKTGVATSNSRDLAELILEKQGLNKYLDAIHTSCEVEKGKPHPDIYLLVAEKLGVMPEQCLVFEDIIPGIMAGIRAGMRVCGISDQYSIKEEEEKKKLADYYITSFEELAFN